MSVIDSKELIEPETNKNLTKITCSQCSSLILRKLQAEYLDFEYELPLIRQSKSEIGKNQFESEKLNRFWKVIDMLTFENIGFTNTVDKKKYLICADCEIGPIGFQNLENPSELFLAFDRIKHVHE
jgi:hypothetical protein